MYIENNLNIYNGDLLKCNCDIIAHQVNCQGIMGAGIAEQIRLTYPDVFSDYSALFTKYTPKELFGKMSVTKVDKYYIANLFGQYDIGRYNRQTDYEKLQEALLALKSFAKQMNVKSIGFPYRLGCGLAGGNWEIVSNIIYNTFRDSDLEVQIWKLR